MGQELWTAVDGYVADLLVLSDGVLDSVLQATAAAGMPEVQVAPNQGQLLFILAQLRGARRVLEIGTLAGYSTIWLARALPVDGRLISLEVNPRYAAVARASIARAGLGDRVEVRVGHALEVLPQLVAEGGDPFDFVFIDADKSNAAVYFGWALRLMRDGGVVVVDNVVRNGALIDAGSDDASVQGVREFMRVVAAERRVTATVLQTVGCKGYDGLAVVLVRAVEGV